MQNSIGTPGQVAPLFFQDRRVDRCSRGCLIARPNRRDSRGGAVVLHRRRLRACLVAEGWGTEMRISAEFALERKGAPLVGLASLERARREAVTLSWN